MALMTMVLSENKRQQQYMMKTGMLSDRKLNFRHPVFCDPEYELVALHPNHFLPRGCKLTVYNPILNTFKDYIPATDGRLRETIHPTSPCLPPFKHSVGRSHQMNLNVFLVILNAGINFDRYLRMINVTPPATPLPPDVIELMELTLDLVELIYWEPTPSEASLAVKARADIFDKRRRNPLRTGRPVVGQMAVMDENDEEMD